MSKEISFPYNMQHLPKIDDWIKGEVDNKGLNKNEVGVLSCYSFPNNNIDYLKRQNMDTPSFKEDRISQISAL